MEYKISKKGVKRLALVLVVIAVIVFAIYKNV